MKKAYLLIVSHLKLVTLFPIFFYLPIFFHLICHFFREMDNNGQTNHTTFLTDEEIIHQIRNGEKAIQNSLVEYLYQRYYGMVVSIVNRLGGDPNEDATFVLNDSLMVLLEKISDETYQANRSSLSTYFYAIAEKQLMNRLRKRKRHQQNGATLPDFLLTLNDVEEKMNSKEVSEKVAAAIQQLDEPCQQVLMKYWLEDKSMKEISDDMDITVDTVKQRNHRCMKKLKDLLKHQFEDWFKEK